MKTYFKALKLETKKQFELVDITKQIQDLVKESGVSSGLAAIYSPHTTAAIRLNHNEPLLLQDIMKALYRLFPVDINYSHDLFELRQNVAINERSNGHAHVEAFFLGSSETLIIEQSQLVLGEKQSIFFVELDGGRQRHACVKILGD